MLKEKTKLLTMMEVNHRHSRIASTKEWIGLLQILMAIMVTMATMVTMETMETMETMATMAITATLEKKDK